MSVPYRDPGKVPAVAALRATPERLLGDRFARQIDTERCGGAAALGVIVGSGYGYLRGDGIMMIPIRVFGP